MTDQRPQLPELRPLSLAEVFDGAMALTVRSYRFLVPLLCMVMAPFQLAAALLVRSTRVETGVIDQRTGDASLFSGTRSDLLRRLAGTLVVQLGAQVVVAVVIIVAVDALLGRSAPRGATLGYGLRRVPSLLAYWVLSLMVIGAPIAIGLGMAKLAGGGDLGAAGIIGALMIAGMVMWLAVALIPGTGAVVVERIGPLRGVGRAFLLSRSQWRRCLAVFAVGTLLAQFLAAVLGMTVSSVLDDLGGRNPGFEFVWSAIGGTVASAAVLPFSAAVALVLYLDLRVRREHFDQAALADAAGPRP